MHKRVRETLLDCGPFEKDSQLRAVFAHPKLRPWRHSLPQAGNPADRVDATIAFLVEKHRADTQENALVLLLRVLSERLDPGDECHHRLAALADELESVGEFNPALGGSPVKQPSASTSTSATTPMEEVASLKRQLTKLKRNLLTIEERKADYIDPRNIPPDLAESEKLTRERIAQTEARLAELEL
jgi:hypothetical protein